MILNVKESAFLTPGRRTDLERSAEQMTTRQEATEALQWANETLDDLDEGQRVVGAAGLQTAERLLVDAAAAIDAGNYTDAVTLAHAGQVVAIEVTN